MLFFFYVARIGFRSELNIVVLYFQVHVARGKTCQKSGKITHISELRFILNAMGTR